MNRLLLQTISRRNVIWGAVAATFSSKPSLVSAQDSPIVWSYPMGLPGGVLGDGCGIFHGYACENIPFYPGLWHTGENWHLNEGETGGTPIFAAADGEVVYTGSDYPGLVIVIQHGADSFSMYGHLNFDDAVAMGAKVQCGERIGSVLTRTDGRLSHLHFEVRTFLVTTEVNGDAPRHTFNCGYECPPGPGYWPMSDSDHPSVMGWRNPTSVIGSTLWSDFGQAIVSSSAGDSVSVWDAPNGRKLGEMGVAVGDRLRVFEIDAGDPASIETDATGYRLWYRITMSEDAKRWVQAAVPSSRFVGSDGRPASVRLRFLPDLRPIG